MAKKYTYSRSIDLGEGVETFTAVEFDTFDEAKQAVVRGIRDGKLEVTPKKVAEENTTITPGPQTSGTSTPQKQS